MNSEAIGIIVEIGEYTQVSDRFCKREFAIEIENEKNPDWNKFAAFQLSQKNCELIDNCNIGDEIKVSYNLQGRKWVNPQGETKYFNTLSAWRIEVINQSQEAAPAPEMVAEVEDLPF